MQGPLVVALITLGDPGTLTGGYLYHRRMADLASGEGARIEFVSFPNRPFPLAASAAAAVLARARRLHPDALVLDSIAAALVAPWLVRHSPGFPLIGMLHQPPGGIDFGPLRTSIQARFDRFTYRRAQHLMVASDALAAEFVAAGFSASGLTVVPPGRDVATATGPLPSDLRYGRSAAILCVGNWVERKGIHDLLEAFARLPEGAATLHLAGDDQAEPAYGRRLRARLARPDLAGRVVVHGPLPITDVAALYTVADAFVLPSRKEPFGTVYGEAMAAGLPVVGWRAGNLPYLAENEQEGLLVEPGDIAGLTRALGRLAGDAPLRERLGEAARKRAMSRPTWAESAALFFRTIRRCLATAST